MISVLGKKFSPGSRPVSGSNVAAPGSRTVSGSNMAAPGSRTVSGKVLVLTMMALLCSSIIGCSRHESMKQVPLLIRLPSQFSSDSSRDATTAPIEWWKSFSDEQLDVLVKRSMEGNLDLSQARCMRLVSIHFGLSTGRRFWC